MELIHTFEKKDEKEIGYMEKINELSRTKQIIKKDIKELERGEENSIGNRGFVPNCQGICESNLSGPIF